MGQGKKQVRKEEASKKKQARREAAIKAAKKARRNKIIAAVVVSVAVVATVVLIITLQPERDVRADVDVDLTQMSETMAYSTTSNMFNSPQEFAGQTIRMGGGYVLHQNSHFIIVDCPGGTCPSAIEFRWDGDGDMPALREDINVEVIGELRNTEERPFLSVNSVEIVN